MNKCQNCKQQGTLENIVEKAIRDLNALVADWNEFVQESNEDILNNLMEKRDNEKNV